MTRASGSDRRRRSTRPERAASRQAAGRNRARLVCSVVILLQLPWSAAAQSLESRPAEPLAPARVPAIEDVSGPLRRAAREEALRLATRAASRQDQPAVHRSWASRHPVLLGTLVGGAIGSLTLGLTEGNSDTPEQGEGFLFGFGLGAGVGALVGAVVDAARR